MKKSRKQIIAQIEAISSTLKCEQIKIKSHERYLFESKIHTQGLIALILLLPSFLVGWKMGRGKLVGTMSKQLVEFGLVAITSLFKRKIIELFKKQYRRSYEEG